MNVLERARKNAQISLRAVAREMNVSVGAVQQMERQPDKTVTWVQLRAYARALRIPIGAIVDEDCDLALKRGAIVQAYRQLLTLFEMDLNPEQTIRATLIKKQLEAAMPDLLPRNIKKYTRLEPYPHSCGRRAADEVGQVALHPIEQSWFSSYDIAEPVL